MSLAKHEINEFQVLFWCLLCEEVLSLTFLIDIYEKISEIQFFLESVFLLNGIWLLTFKTIVVFKVFCLPSL